MIIKKVADVQSLKKIEASLNHNEAGKALKNPMGFMLEGVMKTTFYAKVLDKNGKETKKVDKSKSFRIKSKVLLDFSGVERNLLYTLAADNGIKVRLQDKIRAIPLEKAIKEYSAVKLDDDEKEPEIVYLHISVKDLVTPQNNDTQLKRLEKAIKLLEAAGMDTSGVVDELEKLKESRNQEADEVDEADETDKTE